jgi:hypothetical protein
MEDEPSTPLSTFMSNLIQEQCAERGGRSRSILEVANDNAKTHLVNSRTIAMLLQDKNHNSSNRSQRSCRWGDTTTRSPASVTDYIDISPTAFDKSSRSLSPSDHDPSPSCSRWDLDEDRFLNSSSPTRPSRKLSSSRIAQISSRKNLLVPPNLQTLPY